MSPSEKGSALSGKNFLSQAENSFHVGESSLREGVSVQKKKQGVIKVVSLMKMATESACISIHLRSLMTRSPQWILPFCKPEWTVIYSKGYCIETIISTSVFVHVNR